MQLDEPDTNDPQIKGALEFLIMTFLGNGKNYAQANVFIDGKFYKLRLHIEEIIEGQE